jgi:uncharacterized protein (TIGR03437 family)
VTCQRLVLLVSLVLLPPAALRAQENRIAGPIDRGRTVLLQGNVHPRAQAQYDRGPVDPSFELAYVTLLLQPSPSQQTALDRLLAQQQDPSSPNYHQWLTPEQYAARFGLSPADIAAIVSWLQFEGLKVNGVARGRHWIAFSGAAALIDGAFHTALHRYNVDGQTHFANASEPSIPAALAGVVNGFRGLNDFHPKPMYRSVPAGPAYNSSLGVHYLAPDDFATIYDLNPLYAAGIDGTGQTLAIIGQTDVDFADIQNFRRRFNLSANDPQAILYGPDPGMDSDDLGEADLDLEWSGAVARNATILYVYATDVGTAAQYAIDQNLAPVISFSYGGCELPPSSDSLAFRAVAQQASAQGITWLAASGDSGAAGCDPAFSSAQATQGLAVSYPASIPEVTAVGGTMFNETSGPGPYWASSNGPNFGSALSYIPETAWNESSTSGLASSGGGASVLFSKPPWQTGPGVPSDNARDVPDVALSAAIHDAYFGVTGGLTVAYAGTSAPTPSFAGIVALLNQAQAQPGLGNINPTLYRLAQSATSVFHDITTGNNIVPCAKGSPDCQNGSLGYQAGPGYDQVTGLGSVDAYQLVTQWNSSTGGTITTLTADSTTVAVTNSLKFTATVRAAVGSATPTGTVSFNVADSSLGSAPLAGSSGVATATFTVSAGQLPIGAATVWAIYGGDASFSGSSASLIVTVGSPPGSSAVVASIVPNPVFASTYAQGSYTWQSSVTLTETAGVSTTLTGFTMNGQSQSLSRYFGGNLTIPANGTLSSSSITFTSRNAPATLAFGFTGSDAGGEKWSRQVSAVLYGLSMALSVAPSTVQQNQGADPSCQWPQQLHLQEQAGFGVELTRFLAGSNDLSSRIQQYFGTTQLAPFGSLQASVCWSGITPPQSVTYEIDGAAGNGSPVTATLSASLVAPAATAAVPSVSPPAVSMSSTESVPNATASVALSFTGGAPQWSAAVLVSGRTASWLTVSPTIGSGAAQLKLRVSSTGLVNGVYSATLVIQASNAIPQSIDVPVVLVVGLSPITSIAAVTNAASFQNAVAPGSLATVWGSALAPAAEQAGSLPLPLAMQGVSVTVNGLPAPLLYVSSGQMNIQIPYETGAGTAVLGVENNGQVASYSFPVAPSGPGIFPNAFIDPTGAAATSASPGETLTLFITGDGDASPPIATGVPPPAGTPVANLPAPRLPVTVTVGGVLAATPFPFIGVPTWSVGVTQIDFVVPPDAPLGPQSVVVTVGGVPSAPATLTVGP